MKAFQKCRILYRLLPLTIPQEINLWGKGQMDMYYGCSLRKSRISKEQILCVLWKTLIELKNAPSNIPSTVRKLFGSTLFFCTKTREAAGCLVEVARVVVQSSKCRLTFCRMSILKPKNTMESKEKYKSVASGSKDIKPKDPNSSH